MTITKNIVSDYGAVGDDSTNNDTAFANFRTFARAQTDDIVLTIPGAGAIYLLYETFYPFDGIKSLTINATGATLHPTKGIEADVGAFILTGYSGPTQNDDYITFVNDVPAGATSLTCIDPSDAANFPEDRWCALTALEWQGNDGFPPNWHYIQYVKVLSADDVSGIITFTPAATQDYGSQFQKTNNPGEKWAGGPAALVLMDINSGQVGFATPEGWDRDMTVNGLTVLNTGTVTQTYMAGRNIVLNDCTFTDCAIIPSGNKYAQLNNVTVTGIQIEVDKDIEYLECNDCNFDKVNFQSSAIQRAVFNNCTVAGDWTGTPRHMELYGGSLAIDFSIGPNGYGTTESVVVDGTEIVGSISWITSNKSVTSNFSFDGTDLTYTGVGILHWPAPHGALFLAGTFFSNFDHVGFTRRVASVQTNGSNQQVITCPLPTLTPASFTAISIVSHPCVNVTFRNISGSAQAISLSGRAANKPFFSGAIRTDENFATATHIDAWGTLVSIRVDVTRAYTGAQSTALLQVGSSGGGAPVIHEDGTPAFDFNPVINTKILGERIITPSGISDAQDDDAWGGTPEAVWFINGITSFLNADMSGDTELEKPLITIEIITDQGIEEAALPDVRQVLMAQACM